MGEVLRIFRSFVKKAFLYFTLFLESTYEWSTLMTLLSFLKNIFFFQFVTLHEL